MNIEPHYHRYPIQLLSRYWLDIIVGLVMEQPTKLAKAKPCSQEAGVKY